MNKTNYFISVDWGTTNLRIRYVCFDSLEVKKEIHNNNGIKPTYEEFLQQRSIRQKNYFLNKLLEPINKLSLELKDTPILISGMASSNIGIQELKYAEVPISTDGIECVSKQITSEQIDNIILISGVKTAEDIMRGEETQALGLLDKINNGTLLLPGTHSKHINIKNNLIVNFKTFMTGELFDILKKNTVLKNSIISSKENITTNPYFLEGLQRGFSKEITRFLFSIRSKEVLKQIDKKENYFFLSGLLIGDELSYLKNTLEPVYLASSSSILNLYKIACKVLLTEKKCVMFTGKTIEKALLIGQKKILLQYGY